MWITTIACSVACGGWPVEACESIPCGLRAYHLVKRVKGTSRRYMRQTAYVELRCEGGWATIQVDFVWAHQHLEVACVFELGALLRELPTFSGEVPPEVVGSDNRLPSCLS